MVDKEGNLIGIICHIEAAEQGGLRFILKPKKRVMSLILDNAFIKKQKSWRSQQIKNQYLSKLPIPTIDNPSDKANHDKIVQLVEQMLELNKQLTSANELQIKDIFTRLFNIITVHT